jgi:hypothetical protein
VEREANKAVLEAIKSARSPANPETEIAAILEIAHEARRGIHEISM